MCQSACGTDKGKKRAVNEDSMLCMESLNFYMLADGVGGHNSGEIASRLAVDIMEEYIIANPIGQIPAPGILDYLYKAISKVNEAIYERSNASVENFGMATTAVMLLIREGRAYIINIGDSRAYLQREGSLRKITEDHTYVNELLKLGRISKEEASVHPNKNVITRALGSEKAVKGDSYIVDVKKGDRILLCTDGLYNEVCDDDINELMNKRSDISKLVLELITLAYNNGGKDNITVNCVKI